VGLAQQYSAEHGAIIPNHMIHTLPSTGPIAAITGLIVSKIIEPENN
jgi:hypothetical protein